MLQTNTVTQNCSLPPGCRNNQIQYTLNLTFSSVQLLQISPRPVMVRLQMWGLDNQNRIYQGGKMEYNIRTNLQLFRNYLRDMKITVLKLCDIRNNQQLGTGLINWIIYMRKVDIKTSPFLQNIFDITVPIVNYKKKHIAQIKIIVSWSVYTYTKNKSIQSIKDNLSEQVEQNYFNMNQIESYKKNLVQKQKQKQQIKKKNKLSPVTKVQQEQQQQSFNCNIFPKTQTKLSIYNKNRKQSNFGQFTLNQVQDKQIRYPESKYQLQKAKLKLQAEQFITLTKKQTNFNSYGNKLENFITVRISDLIINKPNLNIQFLDIFIMSKKQQEIQRKNIRIFPITKQSNNYVTEISIRDKDSLQIQLPKGLGKATIQSKSIQQKQNNKLFIYGKTGKLGTIILTKISDFNNKKEQRYIQSIQQQIRQKPIKQDKKQKYHSIKSQSNSIVINKKIEQTASPTIYFLITIHEVKHYQYGQFEVAIKNYTFPKPYPTFSIIPMSDLGSIFAIQFRNNNNQAIDSTYVENYAKIPIVEQSLGCVVLVNGRVDLERGFVRVEIMMGTMKQINYQLARQNKYRNAIPYIQLQKNPEVKKKRSKQQTKNYHNTQNRQQNNQLNSKNESIDSSKIKQQQLEAPLKKRQRNRKMYSQFLATDQQRVATEPNYKYTNQLMQQEQKLDNQQENIWLVQILSKFLHALPANKFSQTSPTTVQQFINLLLHFLGNREQKQLIQLVIDMFIDDISIEQGQPERLQYEQFLKCLKSYHNFLQLWWKMRVDILSQVRKLQPDYINKITQYSQLGTISKQILWKKALHKVDNPELKLKIDKILKLNTGTTISSQYLIDQLKRVQSPQTQIQKQATPDLIVDLGKLIKQTIQSILQGSGIVPPNVVEDRVNIRILCDIFEKINVSLSYWEALMLIEQLKGWYNVDLQLNQGIVSGSVVQVWIKSVLNRSKESSYIGGLSPAQGDQKQRDSVQRQPTSIKNQIRKDVQVVVKNPQKVLEHTPSQRITHRISENKSVVKSQLNQQQIFNIANLLRDNQHFRLGTVSSQKPPSKVFNNLSASNQNITQNQGNGNGKTGNMSKILNDDILNQSRQESQLSEQQPRNKKTHAIKKQQQIDKTPKYLLTKIKSIKIKKQLPYPIKISMRIYPTKQHYFLIKNIQQLQGKQFVEQLTYNWHRQSKGLTVQLIKIKQNDNQSKYQQKSQIVVYGILVNDQIVDLHKKQQIAKTKTIVLYGNKQILGKITLQVQILNKPPPTYFCQKSINIQLQISPDLKHDNQWKVFMINTISISSLTKQESGQQQSIKKPILIQKCTKQKLEMKGTFYKEILVVVVEGIGNCNVPLEELYLKSQIIGQYPVINQQGLYLGNLQIKLSNPNNILKIQNPTTNINTNTIQKQVPIGQIEQTITSKYLIIFDTITTLCKPPPQRNLQILCNIFIKDAINRTILYRSPLYIQHEHGNGQVIHHSFVSEFSSDNYCIIQDSKIRNKVITIQLEYQGRHLGISDSVIKLKDFGVQNIYQIKNNKNKCRVCYQLKYPQNTLNQTLLRMGIRIIPIPSSFQKYNVKRIYKTLSKHKYQQQNTQDKKIQQIISDSTKLTITEQRLLKQIVELSYGVIYTNWTLSEQKYLQLIEQFIFSDSQFSGRLALQQINQILTQILPQKTQQIITSYLQSHQETKQSIDYISLLQYTNRIENRTMNMSQSRNQNQLDRQIIKNVDKIYEQIKRKYAIK